jgi:hypothetical protein
MCECDDLATMFFVLVSALDTCGALKHPTQPSVQTYPK